MQSLCLVVFLHTEGLSAERKSEGGGREEMT